MYCPLGQFCNPTTVACEPDHCLAAQCPAGEACVSTAASTSTLTSEICEPDPCATINCPSACYTCTVTSDGLGTCSPKSGPNGNLCASVTTNVGQRGGGESGCSCAVSGGADPRSWLGLVLGLGLVVGRRRRRS
jgi:MYXO-CTERM domain-containing protein